MEDFQFRADQYRTIDGNTSADKMMMEEWYAVLSQRIDQNLKTIQDFQYLITRFNNDTLINIQTALAENRALSHYFNEGKQTHAKSPLDAFFNQHEEDVKNRVIASEESAKATLKWF
jgi:hypothetical protein